MTSARITVGTTWTLLANWQGKYIKEYTVSRESEQEMQLAYGPPIPTESTNPTYIITKSFLGLKTPYLPSGGQLYARMANISEEVVLNYD